MSPPIKINKNIFGKQKTKKNFYNIFLVHFSWVSIITFVKYYMKIMDFYLGVKRDLVNTEKFFCFVLS